jgi:hypothetical protein
VIGDRQQRVLQVDEFPRDMDRNNLPRPGADQLLPECVTGNQEAAADGGIPFADKVGVATEDPTAPRKVRQRPAVVIGENDAPVPPFEQREKKVRISQPWCPSL